ncbi:ATP-binding protein [Pseudoalteromonas sp.]|uniref:HD domain-containing protein n=1 Tax=Pseudoalteromonas sp. TaxID=53249 RepID=UPI002357DD43|nr:ATP-binding protein [Pseudoalteromonas sp.]
MASKLIAHLKNRVLNDPSLSVLEHQWGFDEQLTSKALQNISSLYPHYSRHDASHSRQILVNIERILGQDRISNLTATDTWLILEAAYWHDMGMIVTDEEYKKVSQSEDFKLFVEEVKEDIHHPLFELCKCFNITKGSWKFDEVFPHNTVTKFRELFAEWFRKIHATRSYDTVLSPWEKCGLSSPRTELIPHRLFRILGSICEMHGAPFTKLIDEQKGLAYREVGIGTDDCHPRFVASLLRLGDLLDIDDNRFCPVMCRLSGSDRPYLSKIHESKHRSIRHFRLDPSQIEVTCVCVGNNFEQQIDTYLETANWFNWLEEEVKNQMTNWTKISPSKEFGLLPTIGEIKISFDNKNFFLPFDSRPEFGISSKKATEILQSIYKDQFSCIRELLQNSVDSTLIELSRTRKLDYSDNLRQVYEKASEFEIELTLEEIQDTNSQDNEYDYFSLKIRDKGCGISINDFKHMLKVGDSTNNKSKRSLIQKMNPKHRPSGNFGIGFQSIFLLTDKVTIESHCKRTNENTRVTMYDPLCEKSGLCTFEKLTNESEFSTSLEATLKLNKAQYKNIKEIKGGYFSKQGNEFDPILEPPSKLDKLKILDKVSEFAQLAPIPIKATYCLDENKAWQTIQYSSELVINEWSYLSHNELDFCYRINFEGKESYKNGNLFFYKGQPVSAPPFGPEEYLTGFHSFSIELNILSGNVADWLTAERDRFRDNKAGALDTLILKSLENFIESSDEKNEFLSFELYEVLTRKESRPLKKLYDNYLKGKWFEIKKFRSVHQINDSYPKEYFILDSFVWIKGSPTLGGLPSGFQELLKKKNYSIVAFLGNGSNLEKSFLRAKLHNEVVTEGNGFNYDSNHQSNVVLFTITKDKSKSITPNYLAHIFLRYTHIANTRPLIPYTDDMEAFAAISIEANEIKKLNLRETLNYLGVSKKVIISPFIFRNATHLAEKASYEKYRINELCSVLCERELITIPRDDAIKLYEEFADYITKEIEKSEQDYLAEWQELTS